MGVLSALGKLLVRAGSGGRRPPPTPTAAIGRRRSRPRKGMTLEELAVQLTAQQAESDDDVKMAVIRKYVAVPDRDPIRDQERAAVARLIASDPRAGEVAMRAYYTERLGKQAAGLFAGLDDSVELAEGYEAPGSGVADVLRAAMGQGGFLTALAAVFASAVAQAQLPGQRPRPQMAAPPRPSVAPSPPAPSIAPVVQAALVQGNGQVLAAPEVPAPEVTQPAAGLSESPDEAAADLLALVGQAVQQANPLIRTAIVGWFEHLWDEPVDVVLAQLGAYGDNPEYGPLVRRLQADPVWAAMVWTRFKELWEHRVEGVPSPDAEEAEEVPADA